ncbi:SDR family oxidoreductase [Lysinibacter cavernae]|uniref:NADP-dependent 3-hydroxy acid dehydrogenase YdfG n=1 Tax=Lysinibacter cavernae TaxID=1640652 RepID=A0A7X5R125_9MICO|nr:SDR family NAD(P)-dependent oxidoreductase [Lysinibacter cavernae]NIH53638.1 NADP-dependent 3-hydroxy acid dehydrogenase YdfG [Lysinibacter cavernae]
MTARQVVVTGASSGIGAATVRLFRSRGWSVIGVARRAEKLRALAEETGAHVIVADLTKPEDVQAMAARVAELGGATALVNNAGAALGQDRIEESSDDDWRQMFEINVIAVRNVTAALLPVLRDGAREHGAASILNVTSTAAYYPYIGGGGYNAAKYAARALTAVLRLELGGEPIRVLEVAPGMVQTEEFALNRFGGDAEKAAKVYDNVPEPLVAEDIAEAIVHAIELPPHVSNDVVIIKPVAQASIYQVHRGELSVRD